MNNRLYCILTKKDCKEMGIHYTPTMRIVLAEHNSGHYTITRYTSPLGKVCVLILSPLILLYYVGRSAWGGMCECVSAIYDTLELCDRRDFYGEDNKYIHYLKNKY